MRRTLACVVVAIAALVPACGGDGGPALDARGRPFEWTRLPDPPLTPRTGAVGVWTGGEVVVVGGDEFRCPPTADCTGPDFPPLRDGAAYSPATGGWRRIADAPVAFAWAVTAVIEGDVYVATSATVPRPGTRSALLRYRPVDDAWVELARPPIPDESGFALAVAGDRLVAYATSEERTGPARDWILDPDGDATWRPLPDDPMTAAYDRTLVGVGDRLVLFDKELVPNPGSGQPSLVRAAVLDLGPMTWSRLPDSEILGTGPWLVDGARLVAPVLGGADGGDTAGWGRTYANGGILDLATRSWSALPDVPGAGPHEVGSAVDADDAVYASTRGWLLDVRAGTWSPIPALDEGAGPLDGRTVVAAGRDLFAFGGTDWSGGGAGRLLADAWILHAP